MPVLHFGTQCGLSEKNSFSVFAYITFDTYKVTQNFFMCACVTFGTQRLLFSKTYK